MKKLTLALVGLVIVVTVACSEQGLAPESPVAPGLGGATDAKAGGKPAADTAVTTTIQGIAGDFDIASDGGGQYTTSVIQSVGAWLLDLAGTNRTVYLRVVNGDTDLTGHYEARLIAQCNRAPYNKNMLTMSLNATIQCPLYVRFEHSSGSYRITMNSIDAAPSNDVNITCTAATTGPCSAWQIAPPSGAGVGVLDKQGRGTTWVTQGSSSFAFQFNVATP